MGNGVGGTILRSQAESRSLRTAKASQLMCFREDGKTYNWTNRIGQKFLNNKPRIALQPQNSSPHSSHTVVKHLHWEYFFRGYWKVIHTNHRMEVQEETRMWESRTCTKPRCISYWLLLYINWLNHNERFCFNAHNAHCRSVCRVPGLNDSLFISQATQFLNTLPTLVLSYSLS